MKKRSLFAAVAMLIVSAIVLTSATYAWFAASTSAATVAKFTASVSADDGSLLVQSTGDFAVKDGSGNDLPYAKSISSANYHGLCTDLTPVSFDFTGASGSGMARYYGTRTGPIKLAYDGATFSNGGTAVVNGSQDTGTQATSWDGTGDYLQYNFNVKYETTSSTAKDVTMKITDFTHGASFTYACIAVTYNSVTKYYLYDSSATSGTQDSYYAVASIATGGTVNDTKGTSDHTGEGIINNDAPNADTAGSASITLDSTAVVASGYDSNGVVIMSGLVGGSEGASASHVANIEVTIWAEGQDANCVGNVPSADTGIQLSFSV